MNYNLVRNIAWGLLGFGISIFIYFVVSSKIDNLQIWSSNKIDFGITGQFGDFIGGVVGTLFSLSGTLLIFLTFQEQKEQNYKESIRNNIDGFESTFFELIKLHRENINELSYTRYDEIDTINGELSSMRTATSRKVFKMIFQQFIECFNEIKNYPINDIDSEILTKPYKEKLKKIIAKVNPDINLHEMAYIDIAYSIIYYGIGSEGESILKSNFSNRYEKGYINNLLNYIKLKPRQENKQLFGEWVKLKVLKDVEFKNKLAEYIKTDNMSLLSTNASETKDVPSLLNNNYIKYYGGHQHRLGHYFRHLFQSYKYLNTSTVLSEKQKYFYGKMLRAQLSTYEQALLFINSISSLGMKWEFTPDTSDLSVPNPKPNENIVRTDLITTYHLIKNLPGTHIENFVYKTYYPNVKYETEE
ncbi:hypothetical protein EXU85_20300 [Spirosoma sp. KCTC 42546]|uniref:putative phage abortive infection protein n=1 Tax=Spirosoma sp. KCTC 42546 TaxID=2520506 RepID=UPI00115778EE|nr:putative phage abortive infection protein [Spirosoma sp. KCTC 42546]QDK80821.1 hypothetical protein EXU85_20300 [Spirosoma sp. KCTC 42546]